MALDFLPDLPSLPVLPSYSGDPSRSDLVLVSIIAVMAVALALMWIEYRRMKGKYGGAKRKISDMLKDPTEVRVRSINF